MVPFWILQFMGELDLLYELLKDLLGVFVGEVGAYADDAPSLSCWGPIQVL